MKQFFKKSKLIIILSTLLALFFTLGNMYSNFVIENRPTEIIIDEERYYDLVDLVDLEYYFDIDSLGSKTYIATFTYEGQTYKTFVNHTFCYVDMFEGDELDLMIMSAVKHHAEQESLIQNTAYIMSYDESTKTLVIDANGFAGDGSISVTFELDSDYGISSYTVTSSESYKSEYNTLYTGGMVPYVENYMIDEYISQGSVAVDAVAGASEGTGEAMVIILDLMELFIDSLEGGN